MKKNIKSNVVTICTLLLLVSCHSNQNKGFEVENTIDLRHCDTIISMSSIAMGSIVSMQCHDSILIMRNALNDQYFSFFNTKSKKLLGHWGEIGNGPLEYIDISSEFSIIDNKLIFRDVVKKEIVKIELEDLLHFFENKEYKITDVKSPYLYSLNFRPLRTEFVTDKIICAGCFNDGSLKIIDSDNNTITLSSEYPFDSGNITNLHKGRVFQSFLKGNCQQEKIARSYIASDILEIYDISDNTNQLIYINDYKYPPILSSRSQNPKIEERISIGGIIGMDATEELLFLAWSSKSFKELSEMDYRFNEILCLNWYGEGLRKYTLPFDVSNFCVTNEYLYVINEQEESIDIYRFKINNQLTGTIL